MSQPSHSPFFFPTTNPPTPHQTYSYPQQPRNLMLHPRGIATSYPSHQKFARSFTNTSSHPSRPSTAAALASPQKKDVATTISLAKSCHTNAPRSTPRSTSLYYSYPAIHTLRLSTCTTPSTRSNYATPGDYSTS